MNAKPGAPKDTILRLSSAVAVFPVIRHARVAKDELNQIGKARLRTNIVRQDGDATLTALNAYHRVCSLTVVPTLVKAMALRAIEDDDTQARIQILALLTNWQVRGKGRELMCSGDMQLPFCYLAARGCTQAVTPHKGASKFRQVGNRRVHRPGCTHLTALVMFLRLPLIIPTVGQIGSEIITPNQARAPHALPLENGLCQIADVFPQVPAPYDHAR